MWGWAADLPRSWWPSDLPGCKAHLLRSGWPVDLIRSGCDADLQIQNFDFNGSIRSKFCTCHDSWLDLISYLTKYHNVFIYNFCKWAILFDSESPIQMLGSPGLILGLHPANERGLYFVMTSLNGWVQTENQHGSLSTQILTQFTDQSVLTSKPK